MRYRVHWPGVILVFFLAAMMVSYLWDSYCYDKEMDEWAEKDGVSYYDTEDM